MYQSPIAAVAELVSNAWDADAENVYIILPDSISKSSTLTIQDDGVGMTFDECQERYLEVGYDRRGGDAHAMTSEKHRPVLGRKGIGKFAGFGIASLIEIDTTSKGTGERTVFELDLNSIRSDHYIDDTALTITPNEALAPSNERRANHGTTITLRDLSLQRGLATDQYSRSLARRFLLHQRVADFKIYVNGKAIPDDDNDPNVEFSFPRDYITNERPEDLIGIDDKGWGEECLSSGEHIRWRIVFHREPIEDEELKGIAVFAKHKLAQNPFFFNLTGGLGGQQGLEYLSGQIEADYIDSQDDDIIATERQRINWQHPSTAPLQTWGQQRVKTLLRLWQKRRSAERVRQLEDRLEPFAQRLDKLPASERRTVYNSLNKLAGIARLSDDQFSDMGEAILTAWEHGRLRELIDTLATAEEMTSEDLVKILVESNVLTSLHIAEAVKAKLEIISGLEERIEKRDLELAVRDYIANNPWLLSPKWETYRTERSLKKLISDVKQEARLTAEHGWEGRVDLVLASGSTILVLEFMRPGLTVDNDHVDRFERYIRTLRSELRGNTHIVFQDVEGLLVADNLSKNAVMLDKLRSLAREEMFASDWKSLLSQAERQWKDFLGILVERSPDDERIKSLVPIDSDIADSLPPQEMPPLGQ